MKNHFEWRQDMSVGERNIDNQHKQLLEQLNKVVEAMIYGLKSEEVSIAIDFFDKYFKEHFSYEEHYMEENNYPETEEHKKKHQDFINMYYVFKEKLNNSIDKEKLIMEVETYLGRWWIEHIGIEDQKYHYFINKNNI